MGNQECSMGCKQYCSGDTPKNNIDLSKPGNPLFEPFYANITNNANIQIGTQEMIKAQNVFDKIKVKKSNELGSTLEMINNTHAPSVSVARLLQYMPQINNIYVEKTLGIISNYEFARKDLIDPS